MTQSIVVLAAFAAGIFATGVSAQERPNFSGAWSAPPPGPPASSGGPRASLGNGWGESFTLMQDSDRLTVERVLYRPRDGQPTLKFRYTLDGSESQNTILMGRGLQVQVSTTAWENDKLVITTVHDVPAAEAGQRVSCDVMQTLSLQAPQQAAGEASLVIETTRCGVLGGLPSFTRTVFTKN
jgi:hypothetical protein